MQPSYAQDLLSLASSLFSTALAVIAIWLSLYFYQRTNELSNRLIQAISELLVSAKTTEVTTTQVTTRALDVLAGHFEHRVDEAERESRIRVAESVAEALAARPARERREAQVAVARAVTEAFDKLKSSVAPSSDDYDWGPFIRRVHEVQRGNTYLSVKWLHQRVFKDEPAMQEALQVALKDGMMRTYHRDNPRRPAYPTLCCELNPSHPAVSRALASVLVRGA